LVFSIFLAPADRGLASPPVAKKDDVLLSAMQQELQRAHESLSKLDPAPYFLSYSVQDSSLRLAVGSQGSLLTSTSGRRRSADVILRIGAPALDNAHEEKENLALNIPHSIVSPSLLFDELEIKRVTTNKDRLPDYPAPPLVTGR
jgi:hypothetical protein